MFPHGPLDFFYTANHQRASTAINMAFSLSDPFTQARNPHCVSTDAGGVGKKWSGR